MEISYSIGYFPLLPNRAILLRVATEICLALQAPAVRGKGERHVSRGVGCQKPRPQVLFRA